MIPDHIIKRIYGVSFLPDGPVRLEDLAYMQPEYIDFDGNRCTGELIVHAAVEAQVKEIFKELLAAHFPIARMRLVDDYGNSDDLSMDDNNCYALSVRFKTGQTTYSKHAYGLAIDINPVQNPYIKNGIILPAKGADYTLRNVMKQGMITKDDPCHNAFVKRGWVWGGDWTSLKDYHHFENISFL